MIPPSASEIHARCHRLPSPSRTAAKTIASRLNSWVPSCGAGAHCAPGVGRVASNRRPVEQVHERSHRRQQYHRTARPTGRPVPRLWRHLRAGLAAMKIHLLWDFLTGSILQLRITPGARATLPTRSPRRSPRPVAVAVRPGLLLSGSVPEPHAGRCFLDLSAAAWHVGLRRPGPALGAVAIPAAADRVGTDRRVGLVGREPSPALPIDRSAGAPRGGRPEATESLREGPEAWPRAVAGVSRMAGLDDLRDQLRAAVADVGGRRRALPARWQIELMFKLWKSRTGSRHTAPARPRRSSWRWFTSS